MMLEKHSTWVPTRLLLSYSPTAPLSIQCTFPTPFSLHFLCHCFPIFFFSLSPLTILNFLSFILLSTRVSLRTSALLFLYGCFEPTSYVGERPLKAKDSSCHRWITLLCFYLGCHESHKVRQSGAEGFRCPCCIAKQLWIMKQRWDIRGRSKEKTINAHVTTDFQPGI